MNYIDVICILILLAYMRKAQKKGAFLARLLSKLVSMAAAFFFYGTVSGFLRMTPLFDLFKRQTIKMLELDSLDETVNHAGDMVISELFDVHISANNNSEIYKLFGVDKFTDYIASYVANTAINIISVLLVFFCVSVIIRTIFNVSGFITSVPGIKQANGVVNAALGFCAGIIVIWIIMVIVMFFALQGVMTQVFTDITASAIGSKIFEYNIFAKIIFNVI